MVLEPGARRECVLCVLWSAHSSGSTSCTCIDHMRCRVPCDPLDGRRAFRVAALSVYLLC